MSLLRLHNSLKSLHLFAGLLAFLILAAPATSYAEPTDDAVHTEESADEHGVDIDFGTGNDEDVINAEHAGEHHMGEIGHTKHEEQVDGLPQLDFSSYSSQIFWLVVLFAALYFALSKMSLPALSSIIENRKNHIDADLVSAERLHADAEKVQEQYEAGLTGARDKAAETIAAIDQSMKEKAAKDYEAFQKRSEKEIADIEARIADAKIKAMASMNEIATEVAADAVQKIIGVNPDTRKAKAIVETLTGSNAKAA